ncbi:hypothetical protein [Frigoriglobus tundricola]|uniref:Uncharacterized protein n=1 Tax=Frigoriglobus tundricola TaxID=2774151 RepID=A0A6M5YPC4_9BACT|nr:hypothetical protein [Frigoriglobus tundricola]QJW94822.1 hypothetical protein FTUN_2348 [Frigoriglobus tundricola]
MSDQHEQHHKEEHEAKRREKRHEEHERERKAEQVVGSIYPKWVLILGLVAILGVILIWTFAL